MKDVLLTAISLGILSYFLGALPFSKWIASFKGIDLTKVGSGNFGATNVYRACGFKVAGLVFFLDAVKAGIPTYLAMQLFANPWMHIGIGAIAVLGHSLSVFVRFKGGRGVAPSLGMLFALAPMVTSIVFVIGFSAIALFRYVAPVSIIGSISFPFLLYVLGYPRPYVVVVALLAVFVIYRHSANIKRLLKGEENKI